MNRKLSAGLFEPIDDGNLALLKEKFEPLYLMYEEKTPIRDIEVAIVRARTKVDQKFLERYKMLKYVIMLGVGTDNIDKEECEKRKIKVINSHGGNANAVAELFFLHLINALRQGCRANEEIKKKGYKKVAREKYFGREIKDKTIGFIGLGAIGKEIVKKLYVWDVKILAYDIVKDLSFSEKYNVKYVKSLEELYSQADIITLHVPLLPSTKEMIDKKAISRMKEGVIIINLARGEIVNEKDIVEGLNNGKIKFYSADVICGERDNTTSESEELIKHERTFFTPHIGGQTEEALRNIIMDVLKKMNE